MIECENFGTESGNCNFYEWCCYPFPFRHHKGQVVTIKTNSKMKTFFKVLGWIFVFIAVVGGTQLIAREGLHTNTLIVEAIYLVLAWLCFRGAKKKDYDD